MLLWLCGRNLWLQLCSGIRRWRESPVWFRLVGDLCKRTGCSLGPGKQLRPTPPAWSYSSMAEKCRICLQPPTGWNVPVAKNPRVERSWICTGIAFVSLVSRANIGPKSRHKSSSTFFGKWYLLRSHSVLSPSRSVQTLKTLVCQVFQ